MIVIMNPPFSKDVDILDVILRKTDAVVVNLSPARWIQEPSFKDKYPQKRYSKNKNICDHLSSLKIITKEEAMKLFWAGITTDLGIFVCNSKEKCNWLSFSQNPILEKVFKKTEKTLKDVIEKDKKDGWRVRISGIKPNPGKDITGSHNLLFLIDKDFYITHPIFCWVYFDNVTPYEQNIPLEKSTWRGGAYTVPKGVNWTKNMFPGAGGKWKKKYDEESALPLSIRFETETEAFNFEKSLKTDFMLYVNYMTKFGGSQLILGKIPFMSDYKKAWADEDFYKFFEIDEEEQVYIKNFLKEKQVPDLEDR